jgi:FtsP/CotA-like multicopper oxidase with cupredoxin domain
VAQRKLTRRGLLASGAAAAPALAALHEVVPHRGLHRALGGHQTEAAQAQGTGHGSASGHGGGQAGVLSHDGFGGRTVDHAANGFNPTEVVRDFDWGRSRRLTSGRTLREWTLIAEEKDIEVAPGVTFAAWTYNGRVPGPTLRCREGERLRIRFVNGAGHPHTIHFHGIHAAFMDGMPGVGEGIGGGQVEPGEEFSYEFEATPFGLHLYHCHVMPLAEHIAKGLYGAFIVDPKQGRADADELVLVMNGFDTNFDASNEVYAANSIPFHYVHEPIRVRRDELVRIYLANLLEFDQINSFHVHANFFDYYPTGTRLESTEFTDTIVQGQGQRGILELRFPHRGKFMFHAHKTEFAELGWLGFFEVI